MSLDVYTILDKSNYERFDYLIQTVPQLLNSLLNSNNRNSSLLMQTALDGKQNAFSKLLEYPQDISIVNCVGENVFHWVSCFRNGEWLDELKKYVNDDNKLKELLNRKENNYGWTSLHCAALNNNNHQIIKWLLLNGADVNATNKYGTLADDYGDATTKRLILEYRNK